MKCGCGGSFKTVTSNSLDGEVIRLRKCMNCGMKFYTKETIISRTEGYNRMQEMRAELKERAKTG